MERFLSEKEVEYRLRGGLFEPDKRITLANAVEKFLEESKSKSVHAQNQYRGVLHNFEAFCDGDRSLMSFVEDDVTRFLDAHKSTGVRPATLAADLRVIRAFASWCHKKGFIRKSFAKEVPSIRVPKGRFRFLKPHQVAPFLGACEEAFRPIAIIAIFCGLRRKEIINLRWDDVDFDEEIIYVTRAKTGDVQPVPMHPYVKDLLVGLERLSEWVFPITKDSHGPNGVFTPKGQKRSEHTTWFRRKTVEAAAQIGLEGQIDFHGLRKTFAMLVQSTGRDIRLTGHLLGHGPGSKGAITDMYALPDLDRQREALAQIKFENINKPMERKKAC